MSRVAFGRGAAFEVVLKRRPDFLSMASTSVRFLTHFRRLCAASTRFCSPMIDCGCAAGASEGEAVPRRSGEVEAIEVHHLVPRGHKVLHELLLRVAHA